MFAEESSWIKGVINALEDGKIIKAGNLGSSSREFREIIQPHIHHNIILPLQDKGFEVVNIDIKDEPGVDVIGDITKTEFAVEFNDKFDMILCTNLLEHVVDIDLVVQNLIHATRSNGYVLITVPYKYKIHLDPIDNGFRPTPKKIAELFFGVQHEVINEKVIVIRDAKEYKIRKSRFPLWGYRERFFFFLGKRYKVSGILLRITK